MVELVDTQDLNSSLFREIYVLIQINKYELAYRK